MGDLTSATAGLLEVIGASPFGQIVLSVIAGLILLEMMGLIECVSVRLLRLGARFLPPAFRERYIEENEAVIRGEMGAIAKLVCGMSAFAGAIRLNLFCHKDELEALECREKGERTDGRRQGVKKAKYDMTPHEVIIIASLITNDKPEYKDIRNRFVHSRSANEQRKILQEYISALRIQKRDNQFRT